MSGASLRICLQGWRKGQVSNLGLREDTGVPHKEPQGDAPVPGECQHPERRDSCSKMGDLGILFRG